jgi:hypothetical protein
VSLLENALTVSFMEDDQVINDFTEDVLEEIVSITVTTACGKHFAKEELVLLRREAESVEQAITPAAVRNETTKVRLRKMVVKVIQKWFNRRSNETATYLFVANANRLREWL